jgi:hypothetical protein
MSVNRSGSDEGGGLVEGQVVFSGYVEREPDPERRAAALLALDLDPTAVAVHDGGR